MFDLINGIRSILEIYIMVKPHERVLVIADDEVQSAGLGQLVMNVANSMQAEAVLVIVKPQETVAAEPPASVAAAMKNVDVIIPISEKLTMAHTAARKEATALGARCKSMADLSLEDMKQGADPLVVAALPVIKERTDALAARLTKATTARVTTPAGTDIRLSLAGRQGISIHGLDPRRSIIGSYAEAAIAPVEGTAEGTLVIDIAFVDWHYILREPMRLKVKGGKVVDVAGNSQDVDKLRKVLAKYENASNIGELGIGTSHVVPLPVLGTKRDAARLGTAHVALGSNNDIGGETSSQVHWDAVMDKATIELDGHRILHNGQLSI